MSRALVVDLYPLACCRPAGGAWAVHLDDVDPEPFASGDAEDDAWQAAWRQLQALPDD